MSNRMAAALAAAAILLAPSGCGGSTVSSPAEESSVPSGSIVLESEESSSQESAAVSEQGGGQQQTNALGALSPEDALEYMKTAENLVIVDVATSGRYQQEHFEGAENIPIEELDGEAEDALYLELPSGRPVLLHCRLGMIVPGAYARVLELRPDIPEIAYIDGAPLFEEYNVWKAGRNMETQDTQAAEATRLLGGQSPEDALEYMKTTPDLVIVEVNAPEWKLSTGVTGALYIPYTEMAERCDEIPAGRPVLLHCGGGIVSVDAYEILQEKRPDIPELSYIAGAPPVRAYNEWLASK